MKALRWAIARWSVCYRVGLGRRGGRQRVLRVLARVLASPEARGLAGVHLVISDAHAKLKTAVAQRFSFSSRQRCRVHFMRNLLAAMMTEAKAGVLAFTRTPRVHWQKIWSNNSIEPLKQANQTSALSVVEIFPNSATFCRRQLNADQCAARWFPPAVNTSLGF